jgi:long-chain acyl-CoA synthetase
MERTGDNPLLYYFETPISGRELDEDSDALAAFLASEGVEPGDRVAVQLQNMPQFAVAAIAAWKAGAVLVPVNPMYRTRELAGVLDDSGARVLIVLEELWHDSARAAAGDLATVLTTSPLDGLRGPRPAILAGVERHAAEDARDLAAVIDEHRGARPPAVTVKPDDTALMVYTSGTTGPPKGATNLHSNLAFSASIWQRWIGLTPDDRIMAVAPLFHITGLAGHLATALATPAPLVLAFRFEAGEVLRLMEHHRTTFTVGAITAFTAMMHHPDFATTDLSALRVACSGGAPVAPSIVERFRAATGVYIHNCYGLTETTSATHITPIGVESPVDPVSGALSVGKPVYETECEIHDDQGQPVEQGEVGELVIGGPQVVPGYWHKPEETAHALPDGRLRTGDVGFRDADGWYFIVDRRKDMIVAAGYKVWPREVEDVLYEHPAVLEAAVVGVPDEYRGETVKAFVSLKEGESVAPEELVAFCRERMAAFKYPREVTVIDELPKTPTGKILRRELRDVARRQT